MVLELSLSPELEDRLRQEAERRGVSPDAVTIELLDRHLPSESPLGASQIRCHDAFLNSYAPQDEGLYDDLAR
ncbi:MAG TPA: hypothetical protein VFI31_26655 [Pirellulales bacterium]|nr:hypothetical protein [Pirellulales bacterium]